MKPGIGRNASPREQWEAICVKIPPSVAGLYLSIPGATFHTAHLICKTLRYPKKLHAAMPFFVKAITPRLPDPSDLNAQAASAVSN